MTTRRFSSLVFALALLNALALTSSPALAEANENADTTAGEGPVFVAQRSKPESKPATYDLQFKLKRGDVLRYDVTHRASIRSTIDETTQEAQTRTDSTKTWKVSDVLPNGEIEFMTVVERVRMVNRLPDREPAEYDSERDKEPPPGFADAARAVGVPLSSVRITPRGKLVHREIKLRGQTSDEDAPVAVRLPDAPVAIGDTWDDTFDVTVNLEQGSTRSIQTRRHHKLAKVENGIATIEVTYQVLSPIDSYIECQLVQRLMEGKVRFDIEAGRMIGQRMDVDKRILGFAGPTSSMQYIMRMEEKLLPPKPRVAGSPSTKTTTSKGPSSRRATTRSDSRPPSPRASRSTRRYN